MEPALSGMVSKINYVFLPGYEFSEFWKVQTRSVRYFDWESYTIVGTNIIYIYIHDIYCN